MARLRRLRHNWLGVERGGASARFFLVAIAAVILAYLGLCCSCPLTRWWSDVADGCDAGRKTRHSRIESAHTAALG